MNIGVHVYFRVMILSRYMPRSVTAGSYGSSIFNVLSNHILFSIVLVPTYIPNSAGEFPSLHTLSDIYYLYTFWW